MCLLFLFFKAVLVCLKSHSQVKMMKMGLHTVMLLFLEIPTVYDVNIDF